MSVQMRFVIAIAGLVVVLLWSWRLISKHGWLVWLEFCLYSGVAATLAELVNDR